MTDRTPRTPHPIPNPTAPGMDYTSPAWNRRKDEALAHAAALRREALDDFWRGTTALLALGVDRTARAAHHLQQRLSPHRQQCVQPQCGA